MLNPIPRDIAPPTVLHKSLPVLHEFPILYESLSLTNSSLSISKSNPFSL